MLPALVWAVAHLGLGHTSGPLAAVVVVMAALPVGRSALTSAQRFDTLQAHATTPFVFSKLVLAATAALWLGVLTWSARRRLNLSCHQWEVANRL